MTLSTLPKKGPDPPSRPSQSKIETPNFFDDIEDEDFSIVESSPYFTQATQIVAGTPKLKRTRLSSPILSSPSSRKIEVPASSPFSAPKTTMPPRTSKLASLMAPAGTSYRPPARAAALPKGGPIYIPDSDDELNEPRYVDSSDDGGQPTRGAIQPTFFKKKEPEPRPASSSNVTTPAKTPRAPYHKLADDRLRTATKSLRDVLGNLASWEDCEDALLQCDLDSAAAAALILDRAAQSSQEKRTKTSKTSQSSVSSSKGLARKVIVLSSDDEDDEPSPSPPPKRRRLIQGRRRQESPTSSLVKQIASSPPAPRERPLREVIELESDPEDKFEREALSPASNASDHVAFTERMLNYLNKCDKVQLMTITKIKDAAATYMMQHQPFASLDDARAIQMPQKKGSRAAKITLGEQVVDAIEEYASALDGIDTVIEACDQKATAIRAATNSWRMDVTGLNKAEIKGDEGLMTPVSLGGSTQLMDMPLIKEPPQMQGHCTMKSYQLYGLNWMNLLYKKQFGGILADDMGLGKTCQVISLMCAIIDEWETTKEGGRPWPNLIVVPPSTLANWQAEFAKFAPSVKVTSYCGPQLDRDDIAEEIVEYPEDHHVVLTTYTQLGRAEDIENLTNIRPVVAVFDEGHKMKNPKTKVYRDLIRIPAQWRLLLTGTPVQNNLMEMIALLQFVEPKMFSAHMADLENLFNQKVSLADVSMGALLLSERVARARTILEPFILQRRKEQVLTSLPAKTTRVALCELDRVQHALYKGFERQFRKTDGAQGKTNGRANDSNNVWMQLRKSAIHPQLFRRAFDDETVEKMAKTLIRAVPQDELRQDNLGHLTNELKNCSDFELHLWCRDYKCIRKMDVPDKSWTECAKVKKMLELIREFKKNGDRALIFTRFAKVIEILAECLASEEIPHLALQGATDVGDRQDLINQFTEDTSITVFLLTTGAGGTGINLVAANKVIIFDQSDNPQDDLQAENRAHRLGQTRPVEVIKLISKDTIEELVHKACEKKMELANKVVGWEGGNVAMSSAEMEASVRKELMAQGESPESSASP